MSDEIYGLTEKGAEIVLGVVSSICHGYELEQVAALNGLANADQVRILLAILLSEAGVIEGIHPEDFGV